MIKAVLFDLDRTLLDRDASFLAFVQSQYDWFANQFATVRRDDYVKRVVALDNHGLLWKDEVYKTIVQQFDLQTLTWQQLFTDFDERIASHYIAFPNTRQMLHELRRQDYKLGLVTNGKGFFQRRTIAALGIEGDFDTILISEEEGVRKPQAEIFQRALSRLGCTASEAVFVGDSFDADIRGARQAGMKTVWKQDFPHPDAALADAVVENLGDLPAIIARLAAPKSTP